jgi:uncharacterized protein (TIGR02118 family)
MYLVTIAYGHPQDPAEFDAHYSQTHVPIAAKIPNALSFSAGHCETLDGTPPPSYLLASVAFADKEAAVAALTSPEGQAAAADTANFATGGVTITLTPVEISAP